jgi:hypothetical protein
VCASERRILLQASKILVLFFYIYGVNEYISPRCVQILDERKTWGLVSYLGKESEWRKGAASDKVIKEQAKARREQKCKNFVHRYLYVFCLNIKFNTVVFMLYCTVGDCATEIKHKHIIRNFAYFHTLKMLTAALRTWQGCGA